MTLPAGTPATDGVFDLDVARSQWLPPAPCQLPAVWLPLIPVAGTGTDRPALWADELAAVLADGQPAAVAVVNLVHVWVPGSGWPARDGWTAHTYRQAVADVLAGALGGRGVLGTYLDVHAVVAPALSPDELLDVVRGACTAAPGYLQPAPRRPAEVQWVAAAVAARPDDGPDDVLARLDSCAAAASSAAHAAAAAARDRARPATAAVRATSAGTTDLDRPAPGATSGTDGAYDFVIVPPDTEPGNAFRWKTSGPVDRQVLCTPAPAGGDLATTSDSLSAHVALPGLAVDLAAGTPVGLVAFTMVNLMEDWVYVRDTADVLELLDERLATLLAGRGTVARLPLGCLAFSPTLSGDELLDVARAVLTDQVHAKGRAQKRPFTPLWWAWATTSRPGEHTDQVLARLARVEAEAYAAARRAEADAVRDGTHPAERR